MPNETKATYEVADAIREVVLKAEKQFDLGKRSSACGLFDLTEMLMEIAEKLDPPPPK